jgi:glycosyltransferase A (GT-A) superfamily protein (DUF2064 family)
LGTGRKLVDVGDVYNPKGLESLHDYPNLTSALEILEGAWLYPQSGDDFGVPMRRTIDLLQQHHPDSRTVIIGSDCITHSWESLIDAGHALSKVDVVIQPAVGGTCNVPGRPE